jgi:hypothetical protein|tara:strand:- start:1916 stop:2035 length:120 start_codon:yes stop_codon:yes gene_type:complete
MAGAKKKGPKGMRGGGMAKKKGPMGFKRGGRAGTKRKKK